MAGCNDSCNCYLDSRDGIETDGLGSPESPYVIGTEDGRHIPRASTSAGRAALTVDDDDIGLIVYEEDTGLAYVYDGAAYGWRALSVENVATDSAAATLSAAASTRQTLLSLSLAAGPWELHAKGNLEVSVAIGIGWGSWIKDDTAGSDLDQTDMSNNGYVTGTAFIPFALQAYVELTVASTVILQMDRSSTNGSQVAKHLKLMASSVPGERV